MKMPPDDRTLRKALGCFASGVSIVTAPGAGGGEPIGVTVSAFSSVSLEPPLVSFCLGERTEQLEAYLKGPVAINVLHEDQRQLSIRFASRAAHKFDDLSYHTTSAGVPVIEGCLANLICEPFQVVEAGDHKLVIVKVADLRYQTGGQPLLYFRGAYASIGKCF